MSKKTGRIVKCTNCKIKVYKSGERIKRAKSNFCSAKCFDEFRVSRISQKCQNCGKLLARIPSHANRKGKYIACSRECLAELWKGLNHSGFFKKGNLYEKCINYKDGTQDANGYIMVLDHEHPSRAKKDYVYQHRLVMEKKIGRYLDSKEVVHHINFNKQDNRVENLMLFATDGEHLKYHAKLKRKSD